MREDSFTLDLSYGLRQNGQGALNSAGLEMCHNLKPDNKRLQTILDLSVPDAIWSSIYARLFSGQEGNYLGGDNSLYTLDSSMGTSAVINTSAPIVPWSMADFGPYVLFSNGVSLYVSNPSTGVLSAYVGSNVPICRCLTNFRGQLISGSPTGYDTNVVLWGAIGQALMLPSQNVVSGYMPMPWQGYIYDVRTLGANVVIYGSNGVALLRPLDSSPPGFGLVPLDTLGILSVGAVGGGDYKQLYVRADGSLCMLVSSQEQPTRFERKVLDYKEWFEDWTDAHVAYDEGLDEFYLTDGTNGFLLAPEGLCSTQYLVQSCKRHYGTLYGLHTVSADTSAYIKTQAFDGGMRGRKDVEVVEVGGYGSWTTQLDWRITSSSSFSTAPSVITNPMGVARNKVSGEEFKLKLTSTTSGATLDYTTLRWKRTDKRFIRGLDASQANARTNK